MSAFDPKRTRFTGGRAAFLSWELGRMTFKLGVARVLRPWIRIQDGLVAFRKPFILLPVLFPLLLGACEKSDALARRLGIVSIPDEVEIARHWSGAIGPDRYELWQLAPVSAEAFRTLLQQTDAETPVKRSMSGCLGLDSSNSPDWWPHKELEDASWDYPPTQYSLHLVDGHPDGNICIYRNDLTVITYIQLSGE